MTIVLSGFCLYVLAGVFASCYIYYIVWWFLLLLSILCMFYNGLILKH